MRSTFFILFLMVILLFVLPVSAEDALEWYTKGQNAAAVGDYGTAVTYYNNALALDPKYSAALSGKAAALNAQRKYAEALSAADAALAIRSSDAAGLNARALALFGLGNYNASVLAYDQLFRVQANRVDAYCTQGYAYLQLQNYDSAVVPYDRCTSMDPQNFMSWNYQGLAYMGAKKYDKALSSFDRATGVTITNATVWNNKGEALVALNRPADALECFKKALGIDPNYSLARMNRESVMGRQQVVNISGTATPVPTISRIGTFYTTATPVQGPTPELTDSGSSATVETGAPVDTLPVPRRTTYSPVSPLTILGAVGIAWCALFFLMRK